MPQRGRPSKGLREMGRWEGRRQARRWDEDERLHELESGNDYGREVEFYARGEHENSSDELYFTGTDLGLLYGHGKSFESVSGSDYSDEDMGAGLDSWNGTELQVAMRDKEEQLVRKAMERIRRAQMLGRTKVRLSQPELDALERKRLRTTAAEKVKDRRVASSASGKGRHSGRGGRVVESRTTAVPEPSWRRSRTSLARQDKRSQHLSVETSSPGFLVSGSGGIPMHAPFGGRESPIALPPATSSPLPSHDDQHRQRTSSAPQYQLHHQLQRYFSVPRGAQPAVHPPSSSPRGSPRPLPDDPAWMPRVRSASSAQAHAIDPFQYQTYSPPALQVTSPYVQERRNVSGPPDIQYSSVRRLPTNPYVANAGIGASSSDPSLSRLQPLRSHAEAYVSEGDEDYDDIGNDRDLQIDEMPVRGGYFSRIVAAEISGGRRRKGRR